MHLIPPPDSAKTSFGPASRVSPPLSSPTPGGAQPPPYSPPIVPRAPEDVAPLVARALDTFWERRRYGEPWHDVAPPPEFLRGGGGGEAEPTGLAEVSRRCFRRLTFDLVGEVLLDMYRDEVGGGGRGAPRARRAVFGRGGGREPPMELGALQPLVQSHVSG